MGRVQDGFFQKKIAHTHSRPVGSNGSRVQRVGPWDESGRGLRSNGSDLTHADYFITLFVHQTCACEFNLKEEVARKCTDILFTLTPIRL
jgi:hypothetical protein